MTNNNTIRSYGPGKFNTIVDKYVYDVSLDGGADEELSFGEGQEWYGLMRNGHTIFRDHDPLLESLNDAERELLLSSAGVILEENSDGFVSVEYFDTDEELNARWNGLEEALAEAEMESESVESE